MSILTQIMNVLIYSCAKEKNCTNPRCIDDLTGAINKGNKVKKCTKCGLEKDEICFGNRKDSKDGLRGDCKDCRTKYQLGYYQENREDLLAQKVEYFQENKETIGEYRAEYYQKNRDDILSQKAEYYQENKEDIRGYQAEWRDKNKETNRIKKSEYRETHKEEIAEYQAEYTRKRRKSDPTFQFRQNFSSAFKRYLKASGVDKNNISTYTILRYTPEEIRAHLKNQFVAPENLGPKGEIWMNEHNQGTYNKDTWDENDCSTWKWQVDHIKPQSEFKCTSADDPCVKICWGLDNLRPYRAKDNVIDGATKTRHKKNSKKRMRKIVKCQ
jgi:hypothetical protein